MADQQIESVHVPLKDHVDQILKSFDGAFAACKMLYEARGANRLNKSVKTLTMADGSQMSLSTLKDFIATVKRSIKQIPSLVTAERKRSKAANRKGEFQPLPPTQYRTELVKFFKKADLGKAPDGKRLQDSPTMKYFFDEATCVGNLTFGVSLFNVWGNIHKLNSGSNEIVLDTASQTALAAALTALKARKQAIIADAEVSEEKRADARKDLELLESGRLQNKDYMGIWSFYCVPATEESRQKLSAYRDVVAEMSKVTHDLNGEYRDKLKASRPKVVKAPKIPVAPVAVAPAPVVPAPVVAVVPVIPTVKGRKTKATA